MAGNLVEFRRHRDLMLGIVNGQRQHKWVVHDQVPSMSHAKHSLGNVQDGRIFHVRGQDVSLVLPGTHYSRSDIALFVENAKGANAGCVEVAWQTMDATSRPLSLSEMANLLLKDDSPMGIYTTYALLKVDRRFFRQVGDLPWNVCCLWEGYVCRSVEIRHYTLECHQAKSKCCSKSKRKKPRRTKHTRRSKKLSPKCW